MSSVIDKNELDWYSPLEAPIRLSGLPFNKRKGVYNRLPLDTGYAIPEAVRELAKCTAGVQAQFQTDSSLIAVRVRLASAADMYNMTATGQCGVDIYAGPPEHQQFAGVACFDPRESCYESTLAEFKEGELRNITVNFPLYQGVQDIQIGITRNSTMLPPPDYSDARPIVIYGTSITQGGCASRPGMAYTNILSRKMNREFVNLGFSGSGKGEPELASIISEIPNVGAIILDYEANCVDTATYKRTLPRFIDIIRQGKPVVPIMVISRIRYAKEHFDKAFKEQRLERLQFQQQLIATLRQAGDQFIHFVNGEDLLGQEDWEECTVDGVHPTDLGFYRMAQGIRKALLACLS